MSLTWMPTSAAVIERPPSDCTNWPNAWNSASDLSVDGSPMITALPPPMSRPATAFLYVMPRDRRSTSLSASASDLYGHIRVPPSAGPSTVLWLRSEEHTSELQSLMRNSYAVLC